jgi:hypothetical protein
MIEREDGAMETPWARVRSPETIPQPVTPAVLLSMPAQRFTELLRGNLLPRTDTRDDRQVWATLWEALTRDERLADRGYGVLAEFLEVTGQALAGGGLDPGQEKRAKAFRRQVREAWARMVREQGRRQPLRWAGEAASEFDSAGRSAIALMVSAIAAHRGAVMREGDVDAPDRRLWSALRQVGLDPSGARQDHGAVVVDEDRAALVWAGGTVTRWSSAARAVAGILVAAIAAHREVVEGEAAWADRRLWHILSVVDLDPRDYPTRP